MKVTVIKSLLGLEGRSGFSWEADIAVDGAPVFNVKDDGHGGELRFEPFGEGEEYRKNAAKMLSVARYARSLPPYIHPQMKNTKGVPMDLTLFISGVVDEYENSKVAH